MNTQLYLRVESIWQCPHQGMKKYISILGKFCGAMLPRLRFMGEDAAIEIGPVRTIGTIS